MVACDILKGNTMIVFTMDMVMMSNICNEITIIMMHGYDNLTINNIRNNRT